MSQAKHMKLVLVDTHTHYYPFCAYGQFFDCAYQNMRLEAERRGSSNDFIAVICLLETEASANYSSLLEAASKGARYGVWRLQGGDNGRPLTAEAPGQHRLFITPGRQVITQERLEVLIVGSAARVPYNQPLRQYLEEFAGRELVIVPWGFGKWLGSRGRVVNAALRECSSLSFALGDNGGRPSSWAYVPQFRLARKLGVNILAGSDPLPIAGQQHKVGSYGAAFFSAEDEVSVLAGLRERLLGHSGDRVTKFGSTDSLWKCLCSQWRMRMRPLAKHDRS